MLKRTQGGEKEGVMVGGENEPEDSDPPNFPPVALGCHKSVVQALKDVSTVLIHSIFEDGIIVLSGTTSCYI